MNREVVQIRSIFGNGDCANMHSRQQPVVVEFVVLHTYFGVSLKGIVMQFAFVLEAGENVRNDEVAGCEQMFAESMCTTMLSIRVGLRRRPRGVLIGNPIPIGRLLRSRFHISCETSRRDGEKL